MKTRNEIIPLRLLGGTLLASAALLSVPQRIFANQAADPAIHAAHVAAGTMSPDAPAMPMNDPALAQKLSELQAKFAQLEAALANAAPQMAAAPAMSGMPSAAPAASPPMSMGMDKMKSRGSMGSIAPGGGTPAMEAGATPAPAMPGMSPSSAPAAGAMNMMATMKKMMGMMDKMMPMPIAAMPAASAAPTMPARGMGMEMMGRGAMSGGAGAAMSQSVLPGFPGASHLYHIGATGFFLDHPQHIALSTEQSAGLNQAKERALLATSTTDRAIKQAEQELWTLTALDQPDATKIEIKIREIGKLTGDERLAFIRSVGEASKILTDEQRRILTGFAPPGSTGMAAPAAPMPPAQRM
jgi:hypothetical protein